jgi:hypothetical protein
VPLLARRWRVVLGAALATIALIAASIAVFGPRMLREYLQAGPVGEKPGWIYSQPTNQSLLGATLRMQDRECEASECITDPTFLVWAALVLLVTFVISLRTARTSDEWAIALWVMCAMLVYPVSQVFYSIFLVPIVLLFFRERARLPGGVLGVAALAGAVYAGCAVQHGDGTWVATLALWLVTAVFSFTSGSRPAPAAVAGA